MSKEQIKYRISEFGATNLGDMAQKENSDNRNDYRSSPLNIAGEGGLAEGALFFGGGVLGVVVRF